MSTFSWSDLLKVSWERGGRFCFQLALLQLRGFGAASLIRAEPGGCECFTDSRNATVTSVPSVTAPSSRLCLLREHLVALVDTREGNDCLQSCDQQQGHIPHPGLHGV